MLLNHTVSMAKKTEIKYADYAKHCTGRPYAGRNGMKASNKKSKPQDTRPFGHRSLFIHQKETNSVDLLVI